MLTKPIDTSQKNVNKAILEILSKILKKWCTGSLPVEAAPKDSYQTTILGDKGDTESQDEEIITETILLRPEDFHKQYPSQEIPGINTPETEYQAPQTADEALKSETIEQTTGEDVPKTVIMDSSIIKTEEDSDSGYHDEDIPKTIIFSSQETTDTGITPDRSAPAERDIDQKKQGSLKAAENSVNNETSANEKHKNYEAPETVIFRGIKDND